MKQIDLREGAKRQHRAAAVFAVIQCWLRGLDGLVFERSHLERILGLERFKKTRVGWLQEDLRDFFPFQQVFCFSDKKNAEGELNSFSCLWASRREIAKVIPKGTMSTQARLANMPAEGPKIALFRIWPRAKSADVQKSFEAAVPFLADSVNFDERLLASYLSLLSQGQISPRSLPSLRESD